jgi:hypothetical protein
MDMDMDLKETLHFFMDYAVKLLGGTICVYCTVSSKIYYLHFLASTIILPVFTFWGMLGLGEIQLKG